MRLPISAAWLQMIRPDDDSHNVDLGGRDSGPQSPPAQSSTQDDGGTQNPPHDKTHKKIKLNMSSKIKIIPNNRQGQLNTAFIGTIAGVLKLAEIALSFVAFILALCADRRSTTAAWTEHITFETSIVVSLLLLGYVCFPHLTLHNEHTREGLIVVELLFYGINTLFYFIAIWLMVHLSAAYGTDGRGSAIMGAILCVALTVLFAIETFMKLKAWRGENEGTSKVIQTGPAQA